MRRSTVLTFGVAVIVFAAIFGGWYEALWKPTNQRISSLNASIASSRTSLSQAISELAVLRGEKAHLGQLKSEVATLRAALPTTTDLQGFYAAVNQAASGAGLPLINIAPTKPSVTASTPVTTPSTSSTPRQQVGPSRLRVCLSHFKPRVATTKSNRYCSRLTRYHDSSVSVASRCQPLAPRLPAIRHQTV